MGKEWVAQQRSKTSIMLKLSWSSLVHDPLIILPLWRISQASLFLLQPATSTLTEPGFFHRWHTMESQSVPTRCLWMPWRHATWSKDWSSRSWKTTIQQVRKTVARIASSQDARYRIFDVQVSDLRILASQNQVVSAQLNLNVVLWLREMNHAILGVLQFCKWQHLHQATTALL